MDAHNPSPVKHKPNIKNNTCIIYVEMKIPNCHSLIFLPISKLGVEKLGIRVNISIYLGLHQQLPTFILANNFLKRPVFEPFMIGYLLFGSALDKTNEGFRELGTTRTFSQLSHAGALQSFFGFHI